MCCRLRDLRGAGCHLVLSKLATTCCLGWWPMKLFTNHTAIEGIELHAFALQGKIHLEGHHRPAPSTESKMTGEMTFAEAQEWVETLSAALKDLPCPSCGRKSTP